ncbi:MAG: hypothetical protein KBC33_00260 [Candidatus Pacebacteria bacterium]|nr:hypothetical protein [Candidatus Paceibacterota bacterium]
MTPDQYELILIFIAVIIGVVTAAYIYLSAESFPRLRLFQSSLKYIALGMFIIAVGVLLAAFINYEAKQGFDLLLYGVPLQAFFYVLYIVGSISILMGARRFTARPKEPIVDVSLQA